MKKNLLVLALGLLGGLPAIGEAEKELPGIAVVTTRGQLFAQPKIDLGKGVSVRLGMEAKECALGGGVLLYCLTDGYIPDSGWEGESRWGPVRMEFGVSESKTLIKETSLVSSQVFDASYRNKNLLYVAEIPMPSERGRYVRVLGKDRKLIARGTIAVAKKPFHPWFSFNGSSQHDLQEAERDDESWAVGYLTPRFRGWALPRFDKMRPHILAQGTGKEPLPQLRNPQVDPGFVLTTKPGLKKRPRALLIQSKESFTVARPDWHFLARWWINGKPFRGTQRIAQFADENGVHMEGKKLRLYIDDGLTGMRPKEGDKIAVQLLYLPQGWQFVLEESLSQMLMAEHGESMHLSNKVEWVHQP